MKDNLHLHRALKYASDMKSLEEQGRLWVLPCKLGEELYIVGSKCLAGEVPNQICSQFLSCIECPYEQEMVVFSKPLTKEFLCEIILDNKNYVLDETVFADKEKAYEVLEKSYGINQ